MNIVDEFTSLMAKNIKSQVPTQVQWARISSVNWEEKTCEATDLDSHLPFLGVLLGIGSLYIKPKVGSLALLGIIENSDTKPFLLHAESIEAFEVNTEKASFTIDEKLLVKNQRESLTTLIADLLAAIKRMHFTTNVGPTINLVNLQEFVTLETRFKNLLKDA